MANRDLTIFETRFNDLEIDHSSINRAISNQKNEIVNEIAGAQNEIIKSQLETADRIIINQDRIVDELSDISSELSDISSTLDWGFSEVIWQLELQTEVIKNILKTIQAPLDTQAKELKKRAEEAYRNKWIDDALKDFLESEKKNRYDFTIHQSLGNIYLFHKKNPEKALEYYEKAVKYTTPYSSHYTIIALLHIGLVRYLQAKFQEACKATLEVIKISPNHYKAHYQYTQYCANLGRYDEAIKHLRIAIKGNRYYCIKADAEKDFDVMKKQLKALFKELRDEAYSIAKKEIEKTQKFIQDLKRVYGIPDTYIKEYIKELNKAENLFQRNSYFDYLDSYLEVIKAQKVII